MNFGIDIEQEFWEAVEENYSNENYSGSVLDAMHFLTDTIRNKTGLEGDGAGLVGQAFGSENPRIQINKLQTDSERDIQKGIKEILIGLYSAIRNPRSHDKLKDTKADADAILIFIDYLLRIIDKSKLSFEQEIFLKRVYDKYFVKSKEYCDLLVSEVPKRQRANIAIAIILDRKNGDSNNLRYFLKSIFEKLEETEIDRVYKVISDELKFTTSEVDIRTILYICPGTHWNRMEKSVKIRMENILLEEVKSGEYNENARQCKSGALGTWIETDHIRNFDKPNEWTSVVVRKLRSSNDLEKAYASKYFWSKICLVNYGKVNSVLSSFIHNALKEKDMFVVKLVDEEISYDETHPWWKEFEEELKEYPDIKYIELPF